MKAEIQNRSSYEKDTAAVSFRLRMTVTSARAYQSSNGLSIFPVCPRCQCTIEREYQCYCDRCGQALGWGSYDKALIVL